MPTHTIRDVRIFALEAHKHEEYEGMPYSIHLEDVVDILREYQLDSPFAIELAYLHDVTEYVTFGEVGRNFGASLEDAVYFLCEDIAPTREARKASTYNRMRRKLETYLRGEGPWWVLDAVYVKIAERLAFVRQSKRGTVPTQDYHTYKKDMPDFEQALWQPFVDHAQRDHGQHYKQARFAAMWKELAGFFKD